jgi:hypothetical protein
MKTARASLLAALVAAAPAFAQDAAPRPEPNVKLTVIEDEGARIEELRVRGQAQRIVVSPKVGPKSRYEIVTGDGSRDLSDGVGGARGAVGQRVWNVLSF